MCFIKQDEKDDNGDSSSDDEHTWSADVKKKHREVVREQKLLERAERKGQVGGSKPKFYEIKEGMDLNKSGKDVIKLKKEKK